MDGILNTGCADRIPSSPSTTYALQKKSASKLLTPSPHPNEPGPVKIEAEATERE
jgi:hypothetical protein